ncbi:Tetratricopeptide repeat-containing protein [Marinitoga hydrogenitolerans DSM 16785]|uniref:Tetratricopeptide repeat-containing protein n=1 Tax=Marinitoga hydrogenitolerans (strain DSM 16785 / JCM 12826 / AT1271) TaxID=1122195 RepID=A0A1M4Z930_MARH1|nr:tetratricopeptide repeat protein [Marinitoga hydrogenitolerans]SHF14531.1 Tetratricopeptide repeat-containing protein [Marinitoga hydrogenitolerans DSM 16785]
MTNEEKKKNSDLNLDELLNDADEINKLMDINLDSETLENKNIEENITDLKDFEISDEPDISEVEKMAEELENKFKDKSKKVNKGDISSENSNESKTEEFANSQEIAKEETIPELQIEGEPINENLNIEENIIEPEVKETSDFQSNSAEETIPELQIEEEPINENLNVEENIIEPEVKETSDFQSNSSEKTIPELQIEEEPVNENLNVEENIIEPEVKETSDFQSNSSEKTIPELQIEEEPVNENLNVEENIIEPEVKETSDFQSNSSEKTIPELQIEEEPVNENLNVEENIIEPEVKETSDFQSDSSEETIPELQIEEESSSDKSIEQKIEDKLIMPEIISTTSNTDEKINSLESRVNNKLEEYEKKIDELKTKNALLEKKLKFFDSKIETAEQGIILLLKNLISVALGDTASLLNSIMEVKSYLSSKNNILFLIDFVKKLKTKLSEQEHYAIHYILGNLNVEVENFGEAEKSYLRALNACEKSKSLDMQFNTSVIQNNLGIMYANIGKKDLAKKYFEESLKIRKNLKEKVKDKYDIHLFYTLNNFGSLEMNSGNLEKAEEYLNEAYEMLNTLTIQDEDKAMLFFNMGNLHREKVDDNKAKDFFEKALKLYEKLYNKNPLKYRKRLKKVIESLSEYDKNILNSSLMEELKEM